MSRCFPYPPPGFERPTTTTREPERRVDASEKEKHKEKKHRKDHKEEGRKHRKDQEEERGQGKDKRGKHRSKKLHKEKHDRKDKDKKKDKDKTRVPKEPAGTSNKAQNEERCRASSQNAEEVDEVSTRTWMVQNFGHCLQRSLEKSAATAALRNGNVVQQMTEELRNDATNGPGYRTAVHNVASTTDQSVTGMNSSRERINGVNGRKLENSSGSAQTITPGHSTAKGTGPANGVMPSKNYRLQRSNGRQSRSAADFPSFCNGKIEGMDPAIARKMGKENVGKELGAQRLNNDGIAQHMNRGVKRCFSEKENIENIEAHDQRNRHNDHDMKNQQMEKEKQRERKRDNSRERVQHNHKSTDEPSESTAISQVVRMGVKPTPLQKEAEKSASSDENTKKRKEPEMNGFFQEHSVRPSKIPRNKFHAFPSSIRPCGTIHDSHIDRDEQMRHSIEEAQCSPADLRLPALVSYDNGDYFKRIAHPDEKYLSQGYSVPEMDEWQEFDEQDWLYKDCVVRSKPRTGIEVTEVLFAWLKAVHTKSADVVALPYVIPF